MMTTGMRLEEPTILPTHVGVLNDARLIEWHELNQDAIYNLVVYLYNRFYPIWDVVQLSQELGATITDAVRRGLNFTFNAGEPQLKGNKNNYCWALCDHIHFHNVKKDFDPAAYWGEQLTNQGWFERLLRTFYDYVIYSALDKGQVEHWRDPSVVQTSVVTVEKFSRNQNLWKKVTQAKK